MELTQMISTSVAGQISSDSSNVVELVTALISKQDNMWIDIQWQGESDVPEDHDKHQDWGQLDVFRLCSLHQRLQRQKVWKETVILSRFSSYIPWIWNYVPGDVVEIFLLAHRSPSQLM